MVGMSADCCGSQQACARKINAKELPSSVEPYRDFVMFADPGHLLKSLRNGLHNWFVFMDGWLVGLRVLVALWYDVRKERREEIRARVPREALRVKNKFSIETAVIICSPELLEYLASLQSVLFPVAPEWFRFWKENKPSMIEKPAGMVFHAASNFLFYLDRSLCCVRALQVMHVPANNFLVLQLEEKDEIDGAQLCDMAIRGDIIYISDTAGDGGRILAVDVSMWLAAAPTAGEGERDAGNDGGGGGARKNRRKKRSVPVAKTVRLEDDDGDEVDMRHPVGICYDGDTDALYVTTEETGGKGKLWKLSFSGSECLSVHAVVFISDLVSRPRGLCCTSSGELFLIVGRSLCQCTTTSAQLTVIQQAVGVAPCGLIAAHDDDLLCTVEGGEDEGSMEHRRSFYIIDEGGNAIIMVSGRLDTGVWQARTVAGGTGRDRPGRASDCGEPLKVSLWRPSWGCMVGKSVFFSDTGHSSVRMLTLVAPLIKVLGVLRNVTEAFGMADSEVDNASSITDAIAKVNLADIAIKHMERSISGDSGKSARAQQGPEGNFSRSSRDAISSICSTLPQMLVMMAKQVRESVNYLYRFCLTVSALLAVALLSAWPSACVMPFFHACSSVST
jgi:hypothetical protein